MHSFKLREYFEYSVLIPPGHLAILLYFSPPPLYFMYLFLFLKFFLCWIFTASRLSLAVGFVGATLAVALRVSSCGMEALWAGSLVTGCGILVAAPGIKPMSLALEGGSLTTGRPGKSPFSFLKGFSFLPVLKVLFHYHLSSIVSAENSAVI